jgi:hypothetical protein
MSPPLDGKYLKRLADVATAIKQKSGPSGG